MSWIGNCPRRWPEVMNILFNAVMERAQYMGLDGRLEISSLRRVQVPTIALSGSVLAMRDAISLLVEESIDPRRFGQWGKTKPFSPFMRKREALFNDLGIDLDAFLCKRIRPVTNWKFVEACYVLLNNIALFRSPVFNFVATSGNIGVEGIEHYHSLTDPSEDYTRNFSDGGTYNYLAYWKDSDCKRWCTDMYYLNNDSEFEIIGTWKIKSYASALHRSNLNSRINYYSWDEVKTFINGSSDALSPQVPQSVIASVLSDNHASGVTTEEIDLNFSLVSDIEISESNYIAPNYIYRDLQ